MEICGPKGRDCIERNFAKSSNCSATCKGIYADIQLVENRIEEDVEDKEAETTIETEFEGKDYKKLNKMLKRLANLEKEVKWLKKGGEEKGEELDRKKYQMLIAEYRKFKRKNVRHIRFNSAAILSAFGKVFFIIRFLHFHVLYL